MTRKGALTWVDRITKQTRIRDLERLLTHLPAPTSGTAATPAPRKRSRTAKQLNQQEKAQLIASYQAGAKLRELGAQFGIHPETVGLIAPQRD
jgi:hypothetical protein